MLDKIRAAYESSVTEESPIETEFALIVPGEKRLLTLGVQEGTFPWGYELEGTVTSADGDTYGTVYEVDCGESAAGPTPSVLRTARNTCSASPPPPTMTSPVERSARPGAFTADTASPIWKRYTLT